MAKFQLKGTITDVFGETVRGESLRVQQIHFTVPAFRDSFGDEKGKEESWCLDIIGSNIDTLALREDHEGRKAILDCFVNSNKYKNKDGFDAFGVNVIVWKITWHGNAG